MLPKFEIIQCGLGELGEAAVLFDEYRQFYGKPSNRTAAYDFLAARVNANSSEAYLAVSALTREAVGFMQLYPTWSSLSLKPAWILNDLYVSVSYRRQGIAKGLIQIAEKRARDSGSAGMSLQTATSNINAQRLYAALGWKREDDFYTYTLIC